tara:strand:+ start:24161 stop:24979 length:819 start_codon:yes stop_codon:yes gene_type:complete
MQRTFVLLLLFCNAIALYASEVDTLLVKSAAMNKQIKNIVITPDSYTTQKDGFSVLYLLHGATGDYTNWVTKVPEIQQYADRYNIIIVCPDGDKTSWYFDSPMDPKSKYETYLSKELISAVDTKYNTLTNKANRAITGLSMGGHGAFYLAFKHQDIWGAAGSMSGGVDIRPFPNNWGLTNLLGDYAEHPENWEQNTVINLVYKLKKDSLKLIFDCGINDFFYDANKRLHKKLLERNIPHDYIERPGGHNWNYWSNSIKYQLVFFNDFFAENK